jgi:hypothetical protein
MGAAILLSREMSESAEVVLRQRGLDIPTEIDIQRSVLVQMRVPAIAIESLAMEQVATATESEQLHALATARRWGAIIVVTSKLHTAPARLAIRRHLEGTSARIIMRASRYDESSVGGGRLGPISGWCCSRPRRCSSIGWGIAD